MNRQYENITAITQSENVHKTAIEIQGNMCFSVCWNTQQN